MDYQKAYRARMKARGYVQVQGIYAPDNKKLRSEIRRKAKEIIKEYNNDLDKYFEETR